MAKSEKARRVVAIDVVRDEDARIVHRVDVAGQSEAAADKVLMGMSRNLNHDRYSLVERYSDAPLPEVQGY